ncbi:folate synthesis bifunctional protein, mitochondrial-like [Panicum miliaceum]|uniref:Folate synthesis bifunctional protein, mitochondrial-like n=1 Tax=Panicum miliaceum TaxID=4540 RepID=A0A3L6T7Y9_PANMI|nr:folate synthesis bifunctional protein, mitochondrial-like [Panicum miliaceum]
MKHPAKESLGKIFSAGTSYYGGLVQSHAPSAFDLRHSLSSYNKASKCVIPCKARSMMQFSCGSSSADQEIVIAMGSNVGDRVSTFNRALQMMKSSGVNITRHACMYETAPAYVTDQPRFLNSAVRGTTRLGPHELLKKLREIDKDIGRTGGISYGPRPMDLDILLYGNSQIDSGTLIVPHERIHERPFVLAPLVDLLGTSSDDGIEKSWHSLSKCNGGFFELWNKLGGESIIGTEGIKRVLPVGNCLLDWCERTLVMGILNVTPDSFSDGGKFQQVEAAISQAKLLISQGADIIDIGAQSTRPFAKRLSQNEELERLIPVLDEVTKIPEIEGKLLSVDTFYAEVATEAVKRGVHMINDVSAELGVPYVVMHMRGDPSTMQSDENLQYDDIHIDIASELSAKVREAELSGIPLWRIVLDPGIGFSKKSGDNLKVIAGLKSIRREMGKTSIGASHVPILLGPSRKSFLREICDSANPADLDAATVLPVTIGILNGANIVRLHNAGYCADAAKFCDALHKRRRWEK